MPHSEDRHRITFDAISSNIPAVAKVDEPFPELLWQVFDRSAHAGVGSERFDALPDGFARPPSGVRVLGAQEVP